MRSFLKNGIPLFIYITSLIAIAVILVGALTMLNVRHESTKLALRMADQSSSLISQGITNKLHAEVTPVLSMVDIVAAFSVDTPTMDLPKVDDLLLPAFGHILKDYTNILAVNHGYTDGRFYSLTALRSPMISRRFGAPAEAAYVAWSVGIPPLSKHEALWRYYTADMRLLSSRTAPSNYDPRTRAWYTDADQKGALVLTKPYVLSVSQELGMACAKHFSRGGGVFAVNILLSEVSDFLATLSHIDGSQLLLLNSQQRIIAAHGNATLEGLVPLTPVEDVPDPVIQSMARRLAVDDISAGTERVDIDGQQYFIHVSHMLMGTQPITLLMTTPVASFTAFMDEMLFDNMLFTLLILCACIFLSVLLARRISISLRKLMQEAFKVRRYDLSVSPKIHSHIFEIRRLAEAVAHMKTTIGERTTALIQIKNSLKTTVEERTRDLVTARDRAQQATDAKSTFLACMSHEIRTPLGGILGMTQLCLDTQPSDQQRHYLDRILFSASNLLTIANDVLDFSKIEAGKMDLENAPFDLRFVLDQIHASALPQAESKGLYLELEVAEDIPHWIHGDALRLTQILNNLLSNALKFTLRGGVRLTVSCLYEDSPLLCCVVKDSGIGLNPEQRKNIFSPFKQADSSTSRRFGGTGLGLSITTNLVKIMGGRLWVDSEEGQGSAFGFSIPLHPATARSVQEERSMEDVPGELWDSRILVVEDDAINQEIAVELLHSLHMQVDVAENGQEALEKMQAAAHTHPYHLVFMDVHMPVMDGLEATRQARSHNLHLPIIALSASATTQDSLTSMEAGMQDHLTKPFVREAMIKALCCWLPVGLSDAQELNKS